MLLGWFNQSRKGYHRNTLFVTEHFSVLVAAIQGAKKHLCIFTRSRPIWTVWFKSAIWFPCWLKNRSWHVKHRNLQSRIIAANFGCNFTECWKGQRLIGGRSATRTGACLVLGFAPFWGFLWDFFVFNFCTRLTAIVIFLWLFATQEPKMLHKNSLFDNHGWWGWGDWP